MSILDHRFVLLCSVGAMAVHATSATAQSGASNPTTPPPTVSPPPSARSDAAASTPDATAVPNTAPDSGQLAEIVVTAERREANLQRVPVAVTALTAATLANKQIVDVQALGRVVPSLLVKPALTPLEVSMSIRGITQLVPHITIDPPIGIYVDGVYNVLNAGANSALIDMERVEVLKGPQGTLFGRNTIGGVISITTAKPTDEFGGYIDGGYGNYDAWTLTGVVNAPIKTGAITTRLVYQHSQHDGYGRNFTTGDPTGTLNQDYVRGAIKIDPTSDIDILLGGAYTNAKGFNFPSTIAYFDRNASVAPGLLPPNDILIPALSGRPGDLMSNYITRRGEQNTFNQLASRFQLKQYNLTGTLTAQLTDALTVKSISGYTNTRYNTISDLDGTPYSFLELIRYPIRSRQFSQELQAYGDVLDGRLKYITGLYYFEVRGSQISNNVALAPVLALFGAPPAINVNGPAVVNTSKSAFAQLTYEIVDNVRLTGGVRYVRDSRRVRYRDRKVNPDGSFQSCVLANAPGSTDPAACVYSESATFNYLPFTVGIDYQASPTALLYAKFSRGFRSGAFTQTGPSAVLPAGPGDPRTPAQFAAANAAVLDAFEAVSPEKIISPEVGVKLELFDRHLRVNAAAYYSVYSNIQQTNNIANTGDPTGTVISVVQNSGKAHIYGGEIEANALVGGFQFDFAIGYTHPKYVNGPGVGTPVINVSKLNYSVTAARPFDLGPGKLTPGVTFSYRSRSTFFTLSPGLPQEAKPSLNQPGFGLLDARISYELSSLPLTLSVYGSNLLNKRYDTSGASFAPPLSYNYHSPGLPRVYGATARYSF